MTAKSLRLSQLSPTRQELVRLCQSVDYGRIEDLDVKHLEPVVNPRPVILRDVKLDADDHPRAEISLCDFVLSVEVVRLMSLLDEIDSGRIRRIEIRDGIPRRIVVEIKPQMPSNTPRDRA